MLYKVGKKVVEEEDFDILKEYIKSKSIKLIRKDKNTYLVEINGVNTLVRAKRIRKELHKAGYSTSVVIPKEHLSPTRYHRTSARRPSYALSSRYNGIVYLSVAAPNSPKSPSPFPSPNGKKPPSPSKNKKGKK